MIDKYCKLYNLSSDSVEALFLSKAKALRLI